MTKNLYSLVGVDGNAFSVMSYTQRAMQRERVSTEEIDNYLTRAESSNYYHLIAVSNEEIQKLNDKLMGENIDCTSCEKSIPRSEAYEVDDTNNLFCEECAEEYEEW